MDVPVAGLCGFLGILPVVSVPQLSGTVGACLAQCWWTVVFPLNPSIREALLSSRSPEEGLATQGATHTHYLIWAKWADSPNYLANNFLVCMSVLLLYFLFLKKVLLKNN